MKQLLQAFLPVFLLCTLGLFVPVHAQEAPSSLPIPTAESEPVSEALLSHAYPNPFRSNTSFDLTVKKRQSVKVEVFNMLGRRVRLIYQGPVQTGETRMFTFEASNLPNGIYLVRVTGEHFALTRQVTLLQ